MRSAELMFRGRGDSEPGGTAVTVKAHGMRTDRDNDRSSDFSAGLISCFLYRLGEP